MLVSKEDHTKRRITTKEFHKRLGMCAKKLDEAKKCLLGGFTNETHETKKYNKRPATRPIVTKNHEKQD